MFKEIIIALFVGIIVFELMEHIVFPLVWSLIQKRRKSIHGVSSLVGKVGEVKQWQDLKGKIFIGGETWNARSEVPLSRGDKAVIEKIEGLLLTVKKAPGLPDPKRPG